MNVTGNVPPHNIYPQTTDEGPQTRCPTVRVCHPYWIQPSSIFPLPKSHG